MIDERFNGGGQAADYIIEYMQRKIWNYWMSREGADYTTPLRRNLRAQNNDHQRICRFGRRCACRGISVMLAWSAGRKRTWGGLVGIGGYPALMDGGFVTAPRFAFFTTEGTWEVENHGVRAGL